MPIGMAANRHVRRGESGGLRTLNCSMVLNLVHCCWYKVMICVRVRRCRFRQLHVLAWWMTKILCLRQHIKCIFPHFHHYLLLFLLPSVIWTNPVKKTHNAIYSGLWYQETWMNCIFQPTFDMHTTFKSYHYSLMHVDVSSSGLLKADQGSKWRTVALDYDSEQHLAVRWDQQSTSTCYSIW